MQFTHFQESAFVICNLHQRRRSRETNGLRVGFGEDTHRLAAGGPLTLGGIAIDGDVHAIGHSDADVLLHAITDAILGGAGLPDIGQLFPDSDAANRQRDSAEMLQLAAARAKDAGWTVVFLDTVVTLEQPKIGPHREPIRRRVASILHLDVSQINVKAKTGEGVGPVGRGQAVEARCVATMSPGTP